MPDRDGDSALEELHHLSAAHLASAGTQAELGYQTNQIST
jgi:hypothetical protein